MASFRAPPGSTRPPFQIIFVDREAYEDFCDKQSIKPKTDRECEIFYQGYDTKLDGTGIRPQIHYCRGFTVKNAREQSPAYMRALGLGEVATATQGFSPIVRGGY